jgi:hypothetical protein
VTSTKVGLDAPLISFKWTREPSGPTNSEAMSPLFIPEHKDDPARVKQIQNLKYAFVRLGEIYIPEQAQTHID